MSNSGGASREPGIRAGKAKDMEILQEGTSGEERCVYLPDRHSSVHYRLIDRCTPEVYAGMLNRGWRRFGKVFFQPACASCTECRSLRIDIESFQPSRSMRRNLRQNADVRVALQEVSISRRHLDLYERFHRDMAMRKGWSEKIGDAFDYYQTFVDGHQEFAYEMLYLKGDRLLGVALVDLLPEAISAVYCYYDPDERRRGLGVFSVLQHVELARRRGVPHVYLGFWVEGNPSMRYKARYQPHDILLGRPGLLQEPEWRPIPKGAEDEVRRVG